MNMPFIHFYPSQEVSTVASVFAATVVLSVLLLLRWKRVRGSYPSYDKIPSTILTHMPTKKDLEELDKSVDVIVSG